MANNSIPYSSSFSVFFLILYVLVFPTKMLVKFHIATDFLSANPFITRTNSSILNNNLYLYPKEIKYCFVVYTFENYDELLTCL